MPRSSGNGAVGMFWHGIRELKAVNSVNRLERHMVTMKRRDNIKANEPFFIIEEREPGSDKKKHREQ